MLCFRVPADLLPVEVAVVASVFEESVVGMDDLVQMAVQYLLSYRDRAAEASVVVYRQPEPLAALLGEVVFQGGVVDSAFSVPVQNDSFHDGVSECDSFFHNGSFIYGNKVTCLEPRVEGSGMWDEFL